MNVVRNLKPLSLSMVLPVAMLFLSACSRPEAEQTEISLKLPSASNSQQKVGALGAEVIMHIVLNVRGPGIDKPIFWSCDSHRYACSNEVKLKIPSGSDRLIQLLVVYGDSESESISEVYYGDKQESLSGSAQLVDLSIKAVASNVSDHKLSGRYADADDSGPTGDLFVMYYPPLNKPPMLLDKNSIVAGFFNDVITLSNLEFRYMVRNFKTNSMYELFRGNSDTIFNSAAAGRKLRVQIPDHDKIEYTATGMELKHKNSHDMIIGVWGPGASSSRGVCLEDYNDNFRKFSRIFSTTGVPLSYTNSITPNNYFIYPIVDDTTCTSQPITFSPEILEQTGHQYLTFTGPIRYLINNGGPITKSFSAGSTISLNWDYLAGVNSSDQLVAEIFRKAGSDYSGMDRDDLNCRDIVLQQGFNKVAAVPHSSGSSYNLGAASELTAIYGICFYSMASGFPQYLGRPIIYHYRDLNPAAGQLAAISQLNDHVIFPDTSNGCTTPGGGAPVSNNCPIRRIHFKNMDSSPTAAPSVATQGEMNFHVLLDTCDPQVAANDSCYIDVKFHPFNLNDTKNAQIKINSDVIMNISGLKIP